MRSRLLAAAILYCLTIPAVAGASAQSSDATVIGATKTAILVWIAEERGYFQDVPGGVQVRNYDSGTVTANDLLKGEIDLATSSEFAFGSNLLIHSDLRALAAISASRTCHLFTRADGGIDKITDLKGRRVGITRKSIGQYFLGQMLTLAGIGPEDIVLVDLRPAEIADAVADGSIDAGMTWDPFVFAAQQQLGDNFLLLEPDDGRYYYFLLTTRRAWLERNAAAAIGIVKALKQAEQFSSDNPTEAKDIIRRRFALEPAYLEQLWPKHVLRVGLPQDLLFVIEEGIRWRIDEKLTAYKEVPDVTEFLHIDALEQVSPKDVGIIR